jgi:hypothetical protein
MPINRERFDAIGDDDAATTAELIVGFLYENRDRAFTRGEIAERIDRHPNTVGTNLSRLKQRNLVQHKDRYWTVTDDLERLSDAVQFSELLSGLTEQFGPIIRDGDDARAWADAQPDEPHPSEQSDRDT